MDTDANKTGNLRELLEKELFGNIVTHDEDIQEYFARGSFLANIERFLRDDQFVKVA